ncbi:MAG: 2-C-methyl-D-erythritol 4-phosphate cytidylyltransferase [Kineosporiaceae bacterium]|nr:2-C-methyl-D-erythritol 4-phosphate cytidylyltransferase [Kineosporiaceae bacterium]
MAAGSPWAAALPDPVTGRLPTTGEVLCVLLPASDCAGTWSVAGASLLERAVATVRAAVPGCAVITSPLEAGLAYLVDSSDAELVLVHDPTYALMTPELVRLVQDAVDGPDAAAVLVTAVTDTLKRVGADDRLRETVDRGVVQALIGPLAVTPPVLAATLAAVRLQGPADERLVALVEAIERLVGVRRVVVDNPGPRSHRVVTQDDARYADALLASRAAATGRSPA